MESAPVPPDEVVVWSPEVEVCLLYAMLGHKPVGVNRHFHMICIRDKFKKNLGRQISPKVIWSHLNTMYDLQALHELQILPFPPSEGFILPEEIKEDLDPRAGTEYGNLGKGAEKSSGKEKEESSSDSGSEEGADKKNWVLNANSKPPNPTAGKRQRT